MKAKKRMDWTGWLCVVALVVVVAWWCAVGWCARPGAYAYMDGGARWNNLASRSEWAWFWGWWGGIPALVLLLVAFAAVDSDKKGAK